MSLPSIYDYTDYRQYLRDWYADTKERKPFLSYRYISEKLGLKSPSLISMILGGKANLSLPVLNKLSQFIGLNQRERQYFQHMVLFNQSKGHKDKKLEYDRMVSLRESKVKRVDEDQYEYYDTWYHSVIRALLAIVPIRDEYHVLSQMLTKPVSRKEIRESLELLKRLGMITTDDHGYHHPSEQLISTGYDIDHLALESFVIQSLQQAKTAVETISRDDRNMSTLTLSISDKGFTRIRDEIREFRRRVMQIAAEDEPERVHRLSMQFFPMTRRAGNRRKVKQ